MKLRRLVVAGAVAVTMIGSVPALSASAANRPPNPSGETLRALAARHGLYIGSAIDMAALQDSSDPKYRQIASTEFNTVTAENAMKWENLQREKNGPYDFTEADKLIDFARRNHQRVRGHVLVWHNQVPTWLGKGVKDGSISTAELRTILENHVKTVVSHFKGKIWQWDVVNEAVTDPWDSPPTGITYKTNANPGDSQVFWADKLGPGYIADAFRWARQADPKALLYYNDYNLEAFGDLGPMDKNQFVYNMVKNLRDQGVPIDGVGSQGHLSTQYGNYNAFQIADSLNKFAGLGVATAYTEVDARNQRTPEVEAGNDKEINPRLQGSAYNYSVLLQGCLMARKCLSFTVWGFSDRYQWTNTWDFGSGEGPTGLAGIYDTNHNPKHAYQALRADLAISGPPYVLPRIPQKPRPLRH
jgi:endo-1,4-beta-xylanase